MVNWDNIDTCVLDMDGTLLDLNFDHHVWNVALPARVAAQTGMKRSDAERYVRETLDEQRGSLEWYCFDHWSAVFEIDMSDVEASMQSLIRRRPGCVEFLQYLNGSGCHLILATNAHRTSLERKLSITRIDQFFDAIVSSHDYGVCKENDDFWGKLIDIHDLNPQRTLFVDDNEDVLRAAHAAGVNHRFGISYPSSKGPRKAYDNHNGLESLTDLIPRQD